MSNTTTTFVGWTSSPDGRGTYDIILTCAVTTFLCCWTSVYPNIPGPNDGFWLALRDKLGLALLGLLGPDFIITLALGQKSSARRSVKKFHSAGYLSWTMTHAFFADMGGFVLHASDFESPIPLDAEQVFYLVQNGHINFPSTTKRDIDDRDKSDGLARFVSVCQALWFIVNLIARAVQGLCITTMEITTLSFVIILFGSAWCWKDKPSDVATAIPVHASVTLEEILSTAGPRARNPYYHTPLDFVSREETALELVWQYYNELARRILFSPFSRRVKTVPWDRIPGDSFLRMDLIFEFIGGVFVFLFGAVFFLSWNSEFPSATERLLWRMASIYMMTYSIVGSVWMWFSLSVFIPRSRAARNLEKSIVEESLPPHVLLRLHSRLQEQLDSRTQPLGKHAEIARQMTGYVMESKGVLAFFSKSHNISRDKDPRMAVPVGYLVFTSLLCGLYLVFRGYILVEDVVGLRSLPPSAYESVDWLVFLPHI
ncbi:hypothetical protein BGZ63DRAFT_414924 [Mariannaea sp. PMI_226]|nr:hypothetical protein BGZ63DRAFT_414924 [Mariannaea sp. PMI_226]